MEQHGAPAHLKHTAEPWIIEPVFIGPDKTHFGEYRFPRQAVDGHSRKYTREEAFANACLMEAAPYLLAACQMIWKRFQDGSIVRNIDQESQPSWINRMVKMHADLQMLAEALSKAAPE